ncbi:MAG: hypothetical protein NXI24_17250 [bacterium]|nr:hypothetical protein [bacterium]
MKSYAPTISRKKAAELDRSARLTGLLKILAGLALLWLLALVITEGLAGETSGANYSDTVAIADMAPVQRKVEWRPVDGSHGYLLQLRDQNARLIVERRVETPRARLSLQPGSYRLRVASLNKFGKPASWSAWAGLKIRRPAPKRSPDDAAEPAKPAPENAAQPEANEDADPTNAANRNGFRWQILIPGLSQFQRGQTWRGLAWMTGFAGLGAAGYGFWQAGNNLALNAEATTPLLLLAPLSGQPAATLLLLNDRAGARAAHSAAQANQGTIGLIAGVLYLLQIADALWLGPPTEQSPSVREAGSGITALRVGRFAVQAKLQAPAQSQASRPQAASAFVGANARDSGIQLEFTTRF